MNDPFHLKRSGPMSRVSLCLVLCVAILPAGCGSPGGDEPPVVKAPPASLSAGKALMLESEPAGGKGIIEVRKQSKDGDEVVVIGRVGGSAKPLTEGRASFLLVDASLKPSAECDCPWDYCEYPNKEVAAARLTVKFTDAGGKTLQGGARELFGIKELSTVVVRGKVRRDEKDNVVVLGQGIFVRPEQP
jgi:hypothetical protein